MTYPRPIARPTLLRLKGASPMNPSHDLVRSSGAPPIPAPELPAVTDDDIADIWSSLRQDLNMGDTNPQVPRRFVLRMRSEIILSTEELWPEGDGPVDPTEKDVLALINAEGGWQEIWTGWGLSTINDDVTYTLHRIED